MSNQNRGANTAVSVDRKSYQIYRRIFDKVLSTLPAGKLGIVLPGGEEMTYGGKAPGPEAVIRVHNPVFFKKCILYGDVGLGESFVDGDWETDDMVETLSWFLINLGRARETHQDKRLLPMANLLQFVNRLRHKMRLNTTAGARRNIHDHYDLGNEFFRIFLDPGMTYSCGYFREPDQTLEAAQAEKYDRLCRKLRIGPSDHILEIGSGWGGFAVHAARNFGCRVTSITISREQLKYARERARVEGLSGQIDFQFTDYRNLTGKFDKIVSIEMLEAVGHEYFPAYFKKCHELLKWNGVLGIQVITCPDSRYQSHRRNVDWMQKHIFPGGLLPSVGIMNKVINQVSDLHLHSLEEMGLHYVRTLAAWRANFNNRLDEVLARGFSEEFIRKWNYYLMSCESAFQTRNINVVQAVFTRPNNMTI
ncbi:MAG: class I SAM-dependent methyltransferase [Acidobacteriota bacterium]|nr:MAG: class I SAM-dependent methyltransferase [Acidobacteriota bacterium]